MYLDCLAGMCCLQFHALLKLVFNVLHKARVRSYYAFCLVDIFGPIKILAFPACREDEQLSSYICGTRQLIFNTNVININQYPLLQSTIICTPLHMTHQLKITNKTRLRVRDFKEDYILLSYVKGCIIFVYPCIYDYTPCMSII